MHEDVVHALDDTVAVDPQVLSIGVRPIAVDPDSAGTHRPLIDGDDGAWRGRRLLGRSGGLGLLNDDDGFSVDLLGRAVIDLDDDVVGLVGGNATRSGVNGGRRVSARVAVV